MRSSDDTDANRKALWSHSDWPSTSHRYPLWLIPTLNCISTLPLPLKWRLRYMYSCVYRAFELLWNSLEVWVRRKMRLLSEKKECWGYWTNRNDWNRHTKKSNAYYIKGPCNLTSIIYITCELNIVNSTLD